MGSLDVDDPELSRRIAKARAEQPAIVVDDGAFLDHLRTCFARVAGAPPPEGPRVRDLLVAYGSARGDRAATAIIEAECIDGATRTLTRLTPSANIADKARQNVRERLFVGGGKPRLLDYDGRGDLRGWVKVALLREAVALAKREQRDATVSLDFLALPDAHDDPEVAYFKARYRDDYRHAVEAAVNELAIRERALLRQHLVLGMSIDAISTIYGVHRATAARWVTAAREALLEGARKQLAKRTGLPMEELDSLLRMIESRLDASVERLLVEGGEPILELRRSEP